MGGAAQPQSPYASPKFHLFPVEGVLILTGGPFAVVISKIFRMIKIKRVIGSQPPKRMKRILQHSENFTIF